MAAGGAALHCTAVLVLFLFYSALRRRQVAASRASTISA
jgi:hypothetical protein